jgi:hypothetical protein
LRSGCSARTFADEWNYGQCGNLAKLGGNVMRGVEVSFLAARSRMWVGWQFDITVSSC